MVSITRLLFIANVLATGVLSARIPRHRTVAARTKVLNKPREVQLDLGKRTTNGVKQRHCTRKQSNSTSTGLAVVLATTVASEFTTTHPIATTTAVLMTSTAIIPVVTVEAKATITSVPPAAATSQAVTSGGLTTEQISDFLTLHNTIRSQHGASALTWNAAMANAGEVWADKCVFEHSGGTLGPWGENIAAGTGSAYDVTAAMTSWTNEISEYDASNPVASHYTQVVWKASKQVGCGLAPACSGIFDASYGPAKFFVCEYFPAGNVIGGFAQNVQ